MSLKPSKYVTPTARSPWILLVGPLPPFVGGAAKNTAIVAEALIARGASVHQLATNRTRNRGEHARSLSLYVDRIGGFLTNAVRMTAIRMKGSNVVCYIVPDGGPGVALSMAYTILAAIYFRRIVIHHRSYNHIRSRSRFMARLLRTAPKKTLHVFLDPVMEERFKSLYAVEVCSMYVPNAATCDVVYNACLRVAHPPAKIGFLSNLTEEKGFDVVVDAFLELAQTLPPGTRFLLGGRPVGSINEQRLTQLQAALGDRLEYYGEVFGEAKTTFYQNCDVFVFPTRFSQEAQPNVLYEAMAAGAAIVSTHWAGVPWMVASSIARLIEPGASGGRDLAAAVTEILADFESDTVRARQIETFQRKKADADARFSDLLNALVD